jgi:DNA polymerase-3 subunit delta
MKLSARDLSRLVAKPDPALAGVLIYGQDAMRVALKRQALVSAIIGPQGEAEMRLERFQANDLRRGEPLGDLLRAQGFFAGPRVVLVEDANDTHAEVILDALGQWQSGDSHLVVTAGALKASAKLRKGFEASKSAGAVAIYDDPPSRDEIEEMLAKAGLAPGTEALHDLIALSRMLDPGDFRQTVEKLALYKHGDAAPVSVADIAAIAPLSTEAAVDDLLQAVAQGQSERIGPLLRRLQSQGVAAVTLAIMALRHFRALHVMTADPAGPAAGVQRLRPPVFGPRRDQLLSQAQRWGLARLERALAELIEADLTLRSASNAPSMAVMERALIRLAMLAGR